jgi:hypothetical protein
VIVDTQDPDAFRHYVIHPRFIRPLSVYSTFNIIVYTTLAVLSFCLSTRKG